MGQHVKIRRNQKSILLILAGLLATLITSGVQARDSLLIRQVSVISPETPAEARVLDVLVRDGRIENMAPSIDLAGLGDIPVIEANGKYLFPGLIDSHTHLQGVPGMTWKQQQDYPEVTAEALAQIPLSYLYHGFTTLIDMNSTTEPIEQWNQHPLATHCLLFVAPAPGGGWLPDELLAKIHPLQAVTLLPVRRTRRWRFPERVR